MDGDLLSEEPDSTEKQKEAPKSFTEVFMTLCPQYMAMGMSYDEFWHSNTMRHRAYREAWKLKREQQNWALWWQGYYFYDALVKVAPVMRAALGKSRVEPGKYPEEPYPLSQKEVEERQEKRREQNLRRMLSTLEAESAMNKKKESGNGAKGD